MRKSLFNLLFAILILFQGVLAQKKEISVETLYSPEIREMLSLTSTTWFDNNRILLYDYKKSVPQLYDLNSKKKRDLFNREKAISSLEKLLNKDDMPENIALPTDFNAEIRKGVYVIMGDIFILDFERSSFTRITNNSLPEKNVKLSPDGMKISFVRENNLYVYDLREGKEIQLTADGSETLLNGTLSWVYWEEVFGRHDIAYWWSDDSKFIAYLQTDESMVSQMHYVDFKPWVPDVITQRYPKAGGKNPQVKAGIVNVKNGEQQWVKIDTSSYEYLVRVNWLPDSKYLAVQTLNRAQTELDLYLAERKSGRARIILREKSAAWVNVNDDLHFLRSKKQFIWVSERDGYAHIYLYNNEGKLLRKITEGDWALISVGGGVAWLRRAIAAIDEKNEWIYFTALKHSSIERQLYRIHFDGSGLERISEGAGTHNVSFNKDAAMYVDRYSGSEHPPTKDLYKSDGRFIERLAETDIDALDRYEIQTPEYFTINASDGFPLPAMILKPKDFDANRKYPLIINVYGGPSAPVVVNRYRGISFDQVLLNNGYIVVKVDPRSAASISKTLENLILYNAWGDLEVNDLCNAVKWLKSQPYIDSTRVGIWGWSGGGTFTLTALTKTNEFKAGIAVAPVSDWRYYDTFYAEFAMKRPQDNPEGYDKTSRVKSAKDLHGRLLLVHGTYDDNVNPQNSWAFANELIKNNIMFDMMIYPMRKHGISDRAARIHLFNTMLDFWNKNLKR